MQSNIPSVRYHSTVYVEENESLFKSSVQTIAVNHCIKVLNGSLESVLHLIGYSVDQIRSINRLLGIKYEMKQKLEFELTCFEHQIPKDIIKSRPTRAHVIEYENRMYGVIVDEGMAIICGQINKVILNSINDKLLPLFQRGVKISGEAMRVLGLTSDEEVYKHIASGQHIVIVSEKGSIFVVPNGDQSSHQFNDNLVLVLGHGFVIIDTSSEMTVHWIRTKQELKEERRHSTKLLSKESIIASIGAISVGSNDIKVYGSGSLISIEEIKEIFD